MSADNWASCPKCEEQKQRDYKDLEQTIKDSYGKIPENEYLTLNERLKNSKQFSPNTNLREDYEIGIYDGEFNASYQASCSKCGFSYTFKHLENIE